MRLRLLLENEQITKEEVYRVPYHYEGDFMIINIDEDFVFSVDKVANGVRIKYYDGDTEIIKSAEFNRMDF